VLLEGFVIHKGNTSDQIYQIHASSLPKNLTGYS